MTDNAVRAAADAMQWVDLLLAVAILALSVWALRRWRRARPLLVGLITVSIHGVVFHVATLLNVVPAPWTSLWSASLRAHVYLFILGTLMAFVAVAIAPGFHVDGWGEDEH